ncbi:MAG: hypothetical protein ACRDHK_07575 [Actinomycetota bacterium]
MARSLEARWEARLAALAEAEDALARTRAAVKPLPSRDEVEALVADLPRLWDAPTTSARDRKRLLRALVADVTVLAEPDLAKCRIGIAGTRAPPTSWSWPGAWRSSSTGAPTRPPSSSPVGSVRP